MGASDFRSQPTRPVEWPLDHYRLIEAGERRDDHLGVCVVHRGGHVFYLGGCHAKSPQQARYRPPRPQPAPPTVVTLDHETILDIAGVVAQLLRSRGRP